MLSDNGPYFFNVGSFLVNLPTMVYLPDWRESFSGSFQAVHQKYVFWSNNILCEPRGTLECCLSQTCIHAMLDSSSICSKGSALQCIFIIGCYLTNIDFYNEIAHHYREIVREF